jgi:hypothetical protein
MLRGCRFIILAIAGLALLGNSPQPETKDSKPATQHQISGNLERIATALERLQSPDEDSGCEAGQDDRQSDLCAQWKAADSAYYTMWAGAFGLMVGFATLFFAWRAAHWAKQAAFETKRNADIAWDIGLAQSSPYVTIERAHGFQDDNGEGGIKVFVKAFNHGPSPAIQIMPFGILSVGDGKSLKFAVRVKWSKKRLNAVGANQSCTLTLDFADKTKWQLFDGIDEGLIHPGAILLGLQYADEFGNVWVQRQRINIKIWYYSTSGVAAHWKFEGDANRVAPPRKRLRRRLKH